MTLPNTDLLAVVTDADGVTKTFDSNALNPGDRPRAITHGSQSGSGFYTGGFTLARPIFQDNEDLHIGDDVKFVLANGDVVYEGYITGLPRSMDSDGHTLSVTTAGWMAHSADEPITEIFVDRDLSRWGPVSSSRRADVLAAGGGGVYGNVYDPAFSTDASGRHAVRLEFPGTWDSSASPFAEAWYDAGPGNTIGRITGVWTKNDLVNAGDANYFWFPGLSVDDRAIVDIDTTANLRAGGPGTFDLPATEADRRYAFLQFLHANTGSVADGAAFAIDWSDIAVHGTSGIPLRGAAAPYGVAASDVIRYLAARYCPKLNTAGVHDTTYPIEHLVFYAVDDAKSYDAFLKVNSYHLWDLAVWEARTLHFRQLDLTDWDWEIRHDELSNQIALYGDSIENLRNGIVVTFTNAATGQLERLHPDDYPNLRDDSIDNPHNQHGRRVFGDTYAIPNPCTLQNALDLGRIKLAEDLQVTSPGSFTVDRYIRDRGGDLQPVSKVRSSDRIRVTSSATLSDRPRLIKEVQHAQDGCRATIAVDSTLRFLDAYVDRLQTALLAAGLS